MIHQPFGYTFAFCGREFEQTIAGTACISSVFYGPWSGMCWMAGMCFQWKTGIFWTLLHSQVWVLDWDDMKSCLIWNSTRAPTCGPCLWLGLLTAWQLGNSRVSTQGEAGGCAVYFHDRALDIPQCPLLPAIVRHASSPAIKIFPSKQLQILPDSWLGDIDGPCHWEKDQRSSRHVLELLSRLGCTFLRKLCLYTQSWISSLDFSLECWTQNSHVQ